MSSRIPGTSPAAFRPSRKPSLNMSRVSVYLFIQCLGLDACMHIVFHEKPCQTWEVMYIKLTNSPVCLIIFIRSSNNPCSSCVGADSSKPLTALLALNFKSKTILGYINPSNRVEDENLQVKESKSYTH